MTATAAVGDGEGNGAKHCKGQQAVRACKMGMPFGCCANYSEGMEGPSTLPAVGGPLMSPLRFPYLPH